MNEQLAVSLLIPTRKREGGKRRRESFTPYTSVHLHMNERGEKKKRTGGKEQNEDLQREEGKVTLTGEEREKGEISHRIYTVHKKRRWEKRIQMKVSPFFFQLFLQWD